MNILIAASTVFTLIALFFLFSMVGHLRRRRPLRATGSFAGGVATAALGGAAILLAFSYYGYDRLVGEQLVSRVEFRQLAPGEFSARLIIQGEPDRVFRLRGDEWQIDARVVSWKPPATLLGLDPIYQLDRISGRDKIFYSTGRLTSEIVMKAALMNIPAIISRSGITNMGLTLAQDLGMIMIARIKGSKFLIYNGQEHFIHDL